MNSQSPESPNREVSGLLFESPEIKSHSDVGAMEQRRVNPGEGGEATAPSIIREIQIV